MNDMSSSGITKTSEAICTSRQILFRDKESEFITQFMGPKSSFPYPSLFIYGHTSTGKTVIVSRIMQSENIPCVWINCHELFNSQSIFTCVISQLSNDEDTKKIISFCDFVNTLKIILKDSIETTYLIFDCAEVLRKEDPHLLPVLSKLQELTRVNICVFFISELPWSKFRTLLNSFNPISLHFPNYTKTQMIDILCVDCPIPFSNSFYRSYIDVIINTFFTVTRNVVELRHLAKINFDKYCQPLKEEADTEVSSLKLWKNIEPTLKEAMSSVYLREVSGSKWKKQCSSNGTLPKNEVVSNATSNSYNATRELPFYSKFLLLAAYFASYNPPKSDFKHFVKNQGKQAKKRVTKKMEKNRHLLGPKPFSLDRLLSIFFTIVGEKVLPSALILSQISSLVNMRLVSRVSADEQLDCAKYRCLAELELVAKIGKTVNIDVMGYLDDFL